MNDVWAQLLALVPVVVGGLLALGGGWIKYWADQREQRRKRQRDKLERLVTLLYGLKIWTSDLDALAFGTEHKQLPSPIEEIEIIGNLYFPELQMEVGAATVAAKKYKAAMYTLLAERLANGRISDNANERIQELYPPISRAIDAVVTKARAIAKKLN